MCVMRRPTCSVSFTQIGKGVSGHGKEPVLSVGFALLAKAHKLRCRISDTTGGCRHPGVDLESSGGIFHRLLAQVGVCHLIHEVGDQRLIGL